MPQQPVEPQTEEQMERIRAMQEGEWMRVQELGEAIGLHEEFVYDVAARGIPAIVDRTQQVDSTGVHALLQNMTFEYGSWLQDWALSEEKDRPPTVDEKVRVMSKVGDRYDVEPQLSIFLLGTIDEHFEDVATQIQKNDITTTLSKRSKMEEGYRSEGTQNAE